MAGKNIRRVKLYSKHREIHRGWNYCEYKQVPWLNVSGEWLAQAGFKVGQQVQITVANNLLIIKNLSGDGNTSH